MTHKFKKYFSSKKCYMTALLVLLLLVLMTTLELTNTTHIFHKQKFVPIVTPSTSTNTKTPTSITPDTTKNDSKASDTNTTSANTSATTGTVTISRVGQLAGSTTVSLRTIVSGISSGNCVIVFSKAGQPDVQQTATVITNTYYYSCAGVDVLVSQFSVSGAWNVSVHVVDSQSATISNVATWNDIQVTK